MTNISPLESLRSNTPRPSVPPRRLLPPRPLDPQQWEGLLRIADCLIPAVGPNPVASEAEDYGRYLELALAARADAFDTIVRVIDELAGVADEELRAALKQLWAQDSAAFDPVSNVVAGAYFMTPQVKALIGYPGQHRDPAGLEEAADELESGILDPVLERGHFYVPTDGG
ncbi:hypothetical protein OIE68_06840 [Nocardia vinacea]|uniref:hypothetical protein n=1 Tax=Nocardia vinacea TaxID=96468 RepID=UPI002E0F60D0|nr:hypothetical protein OIE68_06840 [Nocardia vinacea]